MRRSFAGDFESPAEVIGSNLSLEDKCAIRWLEDPERQTAWTSRRRRSVARSLPLPLISTALAEPGRMACGTMLTGIALVFRLDGD